MKSKKVLWVNPSFLDYRIPLYKELNSICDGHFYLIYSKQRIPERCYRAVDRILGRNAISVLENRMVLKKRTDFANSGISLTWPHGLSRTIKKVHPDIIITEGYSQFSPWAILYATLHRIPIIIAYERTKHTERNCPLWRRLYRRFVNVFTNGYIANGRLTKEYLISQGVKEKNIFTGGMCADSEGLAKQIAILSNNDRSAFCKQILGGQPYAISYVLVSRMIPLKGVSLLLEGFLQHLNTYPDDRIVLVGDGPELPDLKEKYGNNPAIIFVGGIDYSQIYKYYVACDVFVIATLEDNWSLVVPEAMACGLPVACSIYNGCHPELVHKDENGITFDPLNQKSIVEALDYFHHVDIKRFGQRSREIEHDFNPENTAKNVMKAVDYYLNKRNTKITDNAD
jgi:glycosyltransferase involved in cell wall biosynthesis